MKSCVTIPILLFISLVSYAQLQLPAIQWQHTIASRGYRDNFRGAIETPDKSIIAVGSYGVADYDCADLPFIAYDTTVGFPNFSIINGQKMLIAKYDSSGNLLWKKALGGDNINYANGIFADALGGYIIYGNYQSNCCDTSASSPFTQNKKGLWLVKINENGEVLWQKVYGYPRTSNIDSRFFGDFVIPCNDGGMLATGEVHSYLSSSYGLTASDFHGANDGMIMKLDLNGNLQWMKLYGGSNDDYLAKAIQDIDGNFTIIGTTLSADGDLSGTGGNNGDFDAWLLKVNASGNILWLKRITADVASDEFGTDVLQTNDNGILINGATSQGVFNLPNSPVLARQFFVKYAEDGNFEWAKDYSDIGLFGTGGGNINDYNGEGFINNTCIINDPNGGFLYSTNNDLNPYFPTECMGTIYDCGELKGKYDYTLAKTDNDGNVLSHKVIGGSDVEFGIPKISLTSNNDILLIGSSASEDKDVAGNTHHPRTNPYDRDTDPWMVRLTNFSSALPLRPIINFTAEPNQHEVILNWQIPNELNSSHYFVERSFNNISFHRIGKLNATGNQNNLQSYQFIDSSALSLNFPFYYYRIVQVDNSIRISNSNIVAISHPIDIIFTGARQANDVLLNWVSRFEFSLAHYTLQRSFNGIDFTDINNQTPTGASLQPVSYTYVDAMAATIDTAYLYYRLKLTDTTGMDTYSQSIVLHHPMVSNLSGQWDSSGIHLICQTKFEQHILRHYLQKGYNGISFTTIDSVQTNGSSNGIHQYFFNDTANDTAYLDYRIMHVGSTGNISYSNLIQLLHPLVMESNGQWTSTGVTIHLSSRYEYAMATYSLQRSTDGILFTNIDSIQASGNNGDWQSYTFTDIAIDTAYLYYRIMATDSFGRIQYSNMTTLHHPMIFQFYGQQNSNDVLLNWRTKYELNIQAYKLQRSFNGTNFLDLNVQNTAGSSEVWQEYGYTDINASLIDTPYLYYRLAFTDSNGITAYSDILSFHHSMIIRLSAEWNDKDVNISWSSKYQNNILHYQVQRSFNGIDFTGIQTITANGNNDAIVLYSLNDINVAANNEAYQYYRLEITDSIGTVNYSDTIPLHHPISINIQAVWNQLNGRINWQSQFEENVERIILQRSTDNNNFADISSFTSQGNNDNVQSYVFNDDRLYLEYADKYYYRLKIIFNNNRIIYSDTAQLSRNGNLVLLTPNPTSGRLTIQSNACKGYRVTDAQGRLIKKVDGGRQNLIDITHLPNGIYWITLLMEDNTSNTFSIIKHN